MTDPNSRRKILVSAVINSLIALMVLGAFLYMFLRRSGGMLSSAGLSALKYFTTLSNIYDGIISAVLAVQLFGAASGRREGPSRAVFLIKHTAVAAVSVTFLVVMLFLGPLYSYPAMFRGANLWLHLIVPVLSIIEFVVLEDYWYISFKQSFLCMLPVFVYGIFYLINILRNGTGRWPDPADFYGFTRWGLPAGMVIFAVIMIIGWAAGLALRARIWYNQRRKQQGIPVGGEDGKAQ